VYLTQLGSTTLYDALPTTVSGGSATAALPHFSRVTVGPGGGGATAPTITTAPASQAVTAPATATFTVAASASPAPAYQWYVGPVLIAGATSASYTTPATTLSMTGTSYSCTVYNSAGSVDSSAAILTVNTATLTAPIFTTQPRSQQVTAGQTANFTALAVGNPAPTYQWYLGASKIQGATSASYTTPVHPVGTYNYYVVATNSQGSTNSNPAVLEVSSAGAGGGIAGIYLGTWSFASTGGVAAHTQAMMAALTSDGELMFALNDKSNYTSGTVGSARLTGTQGTYQGTGTLYTYASLHYLTPTANALTLSAHVTPGVSIIGSATYGATGYVGNFSLYAAIEKDGTTALSSDVSMQLPASGGTTSTGDNTGWQSIAGRANYDWTSVGATDAGYVTLTLNNAPVTGHLTQVSGGLNLYSMAFDTGALAGFTGLGWQSADVYSGPADSLGWPLVNDDPVTGFPKPDGLFPGVFYCVLENTTSKVGLAAAVAGWR
jgi:hypothetical protein